MISPYICLTRATHNHSTPCAKTGWFPTFNYPAAEKEGWVQDSGQGAYALGPPRGWGLQKAASQLETSWEKAHSPVLGAVMSNTGFWGFVSYIVFPFSLKPSVKLCYHDNLELALLQSHVCPALESMVTAASWQVSKEEQPRDREEGSGVEVTTKKERLWHLRTLRRLSGGNYADWAFWGEANGELG